jgi:hypothetical protein
VKDIPGQENIRPPRIGEMIDSTASSDSDEGKGILDDLNKEDSTGSAEDIDTSGITDPTSEVTPEEIELLDKSERGGSIESEVVEKLALDSTDGEDPLNEEGDPSDLGEDLDIPGAELDDENEAIGEEDEENNPYSNSNIEED